MSKELFVKAAKQIVENANRYYFDGDETVLPRNIATRQAFINAMTLDIAMGGSTNTILHILAIANEGGVNFTMDDMDMLRAVLEDSHSRGITPVSVYNQADFVDTDES